MIRPILKIACLTFACVMAASIFTMMQHDDGRAPLNLKDYIGVAMAQNRVAKGQEAGASVVPDDAGTQIQTKNGVNYMTGGAGDEERENFNAHKGDYNFHLAFSSSDGALAGDTSLTIDSKTNIILPSTGTGPLFYANLVPGVYKIAATRNGKTKEMTVVIGRSKPVYVALLL